MRSASILNFQFSIFKHNALFAHYDAENSMQIDNCKLKITPEGRF